MGFRERQAAVRAAREQRELEKSGKKLNKVGLDMESYTDDQIKMLNVKSIQKVRQDLAGNGFVKAGLTLGGSATERATLGYLSALVEQNWVLMRQNELLINALDKIAEQN